MAPAYPCFKNATEQMLSEQLGCIFTSGQIIEKAPVNPQFPDPTPTYVMCRKAAYCCIFAYKDTAL